MEPIEPVLARIFAGAAAFRDPELEHRVLTEPAHVGMLRVATGNLAIHDPGYEFAPDPLDRTVLPGIYPVDLALRSWTASDGTLTPAAIIAAARVSIGTGAVRELRPVRSPDGRRELVFGVDSGLISIFDRSLLEDLAGIAILDAVPGSAPDRPATEPHAHIAPGPRGSSVFVCQAGMGDGGYRAWWGVDAEDETVALIMDFGLLEYSLWRTVEFAAAALLGSGARLRLATAGTGLELEPVPFASTGLDGPPGMTGNLVALRRPPGPYWEFRLLDSDGTLIGSPGLGQLIPGPWFELFDRAQVERASTVTVRIREGTAPLEPLAEA
jgi:hypothetical protein